MSEIPKKSRREAFKVLGGLIVCGGSAFGIVHYMVRREASADETVKLGPISDFRVGEFEKRTVTVTEHGADFAPTVLVWQGAVSGWTHVAVVYANGTPSLYVNGTHVRTGVATNLTVHPSTTMGGATGWGHESGVQ